MLRGGNSNFNRQVAMSLKSQALHHTILPLSKRFVLITSSMQSNFHGRSIKLNLASNVSRKERTMAKISF